MFTNENTTYNFTVTYNNGNESNFACTPLEVETWAMSYRVASATRESGVASIRLIGETQAMNDTYWNGFNKAKEMN